MKGKYNRYYTVMEDGSYKVVNVIVGQPIPSGYIHGLPPHSEESRKKTRIGLTRSGHGRGHQKGDLQRLRMSVASTNKPKDNQHRSNMSRAHLEKNAMVKEYLQLHPHLKYREAYKIITQQQGKQNRTVRSKRLVERYLPMVSPDEDK